MEKQLCNLPSFQAASLPSATGGAEALDGVGKIRILRLPDVIARVGLKHTSIYQFISDGNFPRPVSLGSRAVGWIEYEIDAWLAERVQISRKYNERRRRDV